MSKSIFASALVLAAVGSASAAIVTNNQVASRSSLGVGTTLSPLDISALPYLNGSLTGINSYSQNFVGPGGNYSGRLGVEVFGNVSEPGAGLSDLLLVYTFVGDGAPFNRANGAETFTFGVDTSVEIDYATLSTATHGKIVSDTAVQSGQLEPEITLNDFVSGNDTFGFDFSPGSTTGRVAELGGNTAANPGSTETFTWYVRTTGNVQLNFVDVRITDFGAVTIRSLALVNNPGQPNLSVPAPGFAAVAGLAGLMGLRRRRA
jgi:hypothetical protein